MAIFTIPHPRRHVESRFMDRLLLVNCSMSQKQGPPPLGRNDWPAHILSGCGLLVNLSAAALLSALVAAIPGASNIDKFETQHKSRFTHLHSTLLPQVTGQRNRRRLASPLHGTLTPGRISVGRPLSGSWTGVSLSLTESSQNSLPSAVSRTDGNRWAPYIQAALMELFGETCPLLMYPRFHRWSWRILRRRLPLSSRGPVRNVSKSLDIQFSR